MDLIIFFIALSILVLVHELGHFLAAKITGVKVEEFGLGLPPRMIGKKIGETVFSLNWLPIGGFCKLYGEEAVEKGSRAFNNKNPWQKFLIVIGGVLMNMILAVVIFTVVYSILGVPVETNRVKIVGITKNSPAEIAGLRENDVVESVNGIKITKPQELTDEVGKFKGKEVSMKVLKSESQKIEEVMVEVRENPPVGEGSMGVAISNTEMKKFAWWQFYKGIGAGFKEAFFWGRVILDGVLTMFGNIIQGQVPKDVAGPIGMYQATSSIRENGGLLAVFHFFAVVSVNLAVVNILPFPALDGGRILFVFYEFIFRKRANEKFEMMVNNFGMMALLALILLITVGDVARILQK